MILRLRRPLTLLCALALAIGVAACGSHHPHMTASAGGVQNIADANNNGAYIMAGPITYQLQVSRQLNQYDFEDSHYVRGLPAGISRRLGPTQLWYGVFLWAKNQTDRPQTTSDSFEIVDTQGNVYHPVALDHRTNPFAWRAMRLTPGATEPRAGSIAGDGATQGGLVLFKVSQSVYDDRPLTFYILGANNKKLGEISLDL